MDAELQVESKFALAVNKFIIKVGHYCSVLNVILIGVIILQVVLRYVFGMGMVQLEELQWHLYAVNVIFGLAYCQAMDSHIRLDLIHDKLSRGTKECIEIFGILFLLMPLIYVVFIHGLDFTWEAIRTHERSDSPMGLPFRWIPKGLIPVAMVLLFSSSVARLVRAFHYLLHTRKKG